MTDNIAGKTIVITGASSGMGAAAARYLATKGANVVLGARRSDRIDALAAELIEAGHKATAVVTDVTRQEDLRKLIDAAVETYGRVDVLINNAGVMPLSPMDRLKVDEWDQMIDVNVKGVLYGIAAALPHMKEQVGPHYQSILRGRPQALRGLGSILGHQIRSEGIVGGAAAGDGALQHPHDDHLARRRQDGAAGPHQ